MKNISSIDPNTLIILSALVSLALSDNKSADQLEFIGNFLTSVADLVLLKAGQISLQESNNDRQQKIADLENQLKELKKLCC